MAQLYKANLSGAKLIEVVPKRCVPYCGGPHRSEPKGASLWGETLTEGIVQADRRAVEVIDGLRS